MSKADRILPFITILLVPQQQSVNLFFKKGHFHGEKVSYEKKKTKIPHFVPFEIFDRVCLTGLFRDPFLCHLSICSGQ